jgi:GR25 family glycosyltransferase involved in LPS biosynthesis
MKSKYTKYILLIVFLVVIALIYTGRFVEGFEAPPVTHTVPEALKLDDIPILKDVWIINLDKSKERWNAMVDEAKALDPLPVNRWSATDGRLMKEQDYIDEKIPIIIRPQFALDSKQEQRKGEIGCYLSHKKLIEFLGKKKVDDDIGHLILEDDVEIDKGTLNSWIKVADKLNKDWDMFFFGIHDPVLGEVKDGIAKVKSIQSMHAYMIKQKSIPKILDVIKIMYDPIDEIIRWNTDKLNLYAIQPFVIAQKKNYKSDIKGVVT